MNERILESGLTDPNTDKDQNPHAVERFENGPRRTVWVVVFWTVMAITSLTLLSFGFFIDDPGPMELAVIIFFSALVPICSFAGAYAGLGNHILRWPAVVIVGPLIGWYANFSAGGGELIEFEVFCLGTTGTVAVTTLLLRRLKGDLRCVGPQGSHADGLQFGIKDLLIWTTVAAILVAIGQALIKLGDRNDSHVADQIPMIFGIAASLAIATVINIWALFGQRITTLKLSAVFVMTGICAASCFWLSSQWSWGTIPIVNQIVVVGLIIALRQYGYRFVKRQNQ